VHISKKRISSMNANEAKKRKREERKEESRKKAILTNRLASLQEEIVDEDTRVREEETTCTVFNIICLMIERIENPDSDVGEGSDLEWKDNDEIEE